MASKDYILEGGLSITIYKRRNSRSLRLSLTPHGKVRVTIPSWVPYRAGVDFANSRRQWINDQRILPTLLTDGQSIGIAHRLAFTTSQTATKPTSRIKQGEVTVTYPTELSVKHESVQSTAQKAAIRALRLQAERLLPQRLATLADIYGFTYQSVKVKQLKGRWGSCDQDKNIVLNLYLMQLSWDLIDYVLLHELTHTIILKHGKDFWAKMETVLPDVKQRRRNLRERRPVLNG